MFRKTVSGVFTALMLAWLALDRLATAHTLPSDLQSWWEAYMKDFTMAGIVILILSIVVFVYLLWPTLARMLNKTSAKNGLMVGAGDDRSIKNNTVHGSYNVLNSGDIYHAPPARKLDAAAKKVLLDRFDPQRETLVESVGTPEAAAYSREIMAFLREQGFLNLGDATVISAPPMVGQNAFVRSDGVQVVSIGHRLSE